MEKYQMDGLKGKPILFIYFLFIFVYSNAQNQYRYSINIKDVKSDKIKVELAPPQLNEDEVRFQFPSIVPGTYAIYDFGRFIDSFKVFNNAGDTLPYTRKDINTYIIPSAKKIHKIQYWVNDTWDTDDMEKFVFEPGGTNIQSNKNYVLNNHGFFGYFRGYQMLPFEITVNKPNGFYPSCGLENLSIKDEQDIIKAASYNELVDSPIMYCLPDTAFIQVAEAKVLVSVYSPNKLVNARTIARNIETVLQAQKDYLGGTLPVNKYAFIIYLASEPTKSNSTGALEHSYSSMYVLMEGDSASISQGMRDVAAHEFFHIVTPLTIHSEEIGNFDFNEPRMSKHLWFYEGLTEYSAHHVQVKYGLIDFQNFFGVIKEKMVEAQEYYNDTLPFTRMSEFVLDKYHKEYQNVYAKGMLISMCLDILLRFETNGNYGVQNLVKDLQTKYGKDKAFKDDNFFNDIESFTSKEIRNFLDNYVSGNKPLPYSEIFDKVGLIYTARIETKEISLGGMGMGLNMENNRLVITDLEDINEFGKKMKYKLGDELIRFNQENIDGKNFIEVFERYVVNAKIGEKLEVDVIRRKGKKEKQKTLKAKIKPATVVDTHVINVNKDAGLKQILARNAWLGINQ
jgi:predicted metalloprotease with PDZ domain